MWCPVTQDVFLLIDDLERVAGIEPANSRWQRDRLPLHHTRTNLVDRGRIELPLHACKAHVLPLSLTAHKTWSEYKDLNLGRLVPNQVCYQTTLYSDTTWFS